MHARGAGGELLLGIDIGTSSSKGVLVRADGVIVATAERPHSFATPHPGWAEHDAEAVWWGEFVALCSELAPQARGHIVAVCTSGIGPCLLVADADGRPLRPAILYGIDTRATSQIAALTERFGAAEILRRGGTALSSQAVGPKLAWVREREPDVWSRTARIFMPSSFIVWRLTNEYVLDHHSASQSDPLYDIDGQRWNTEWAETVAPGLPLPRLLWPGEVAGRVGRRAASETGLPAGIPVAAGTIDAWAEAHSVNVRAPGDVMIMYGSTLMVVAFVDRALRHEGLWSTTGVVPGSRCLATGLATAGTLLAWSAQVTGASLTELGAEAESLPAGSDGLVVLPYFSGERAPVNDPAARGLVLGLTLRHGRGHLYRALLEATGYAARHIVETLRSAGVTETRIVAVGGGARNALWTQIVSDVLGRPQEVPHVTIGASYGDALLAAVAAGIADGHAAWNTPGTVVAPRAVDVYETLYPLYRQLYPATRSQAHVLASLQEMSR